MKKRFVTTLLALIACIACALGLVACGDKADPVAGKTYKFERATIDSGAEGSEKETTEAQLNQLYTGSILSFGNDGDYTLTVMNNPTNGTYTQSDAMLTLTYDNLSQQATLSNDKIVVSFEFSGMKTSLTYTLQA